MYQQNISQQSYNQHQHVPFQDGDLANTVLCELKRVAREYATACLEASNMDIRHLFEQLLHQTLGDQEYLYQTMSQLNLYGQPSSAPQQELQKETQHHQQQLGGLQNFMQQWHGSSRGGQAGFRQNENIQQQQFQQQNQYQQQFRQNNMQIQQQHHSSSLPEATRETGSKSLNNYTTDNPFPPVDRFRGA